MSMTNRGQAAMEFLMTYGWAILVVLVAIGALAYFGVLSPDRFLPERCTGPAGLDCVDKAQINAPSNGVTLAVRNNLGFPISVYDQSSGTTNECGGASCAPTGTDNCASMGTPATPAGQAAGDLVLLGNNSAVTSEGYKILNNQAFSVRWTCSPALALGRFKSELSFWYVNNETGVYHKSTFSVRGTS